MKPRRIRYSDAEMQWLQDNRMMVISDYHSAFCTEFGRSDVIAAHLHGLRKRKGWKVGRAPGRFIGRGRSYSPIEIAWLRDNSSLAIADCHRAFQERFNRPEITAQKLHSLRKREGLKTGRTGHFPKGAVPWSKGKKIGNNPGSARTQFKAGQSPANTKYEGHERVASHGYVEISIKETNPHTGFERRYVLKHRWLWEQMHGPIPEGMVLKCKGDILDTDPSNWELVPRGLLPRLNGRFGRDYDNAPSELKPTIMAVAKLEHGIREKYPDKSRKASA